MCVALHELDVGLTLHFDHVCLNVQIDPTPVHQVLRLIFTQVLEVKIRRILLHGTCLTPS